jgi:hypothetical protein
MLRRLTIGLVAVMLLAQCSAMHQLQPQKVPGAYLVVFKSFAPEEGTFSDAFMQSANRGLQKRLGRLVTVSSTDSAEATPEFEGWARVTLDGNFIQEPETKADQYAWGFARYEVHYGGIVRHGVVSMNQPAYLGTRAGTAAARDLGDRLAVAVARDFASVRKGTSATIHV